MNKTIVLYPEYLQNFKCIGSNCEDTCCSGWNIPIDKATYKKYQKEKSQKLDILDNVKRNKKNASENNYAQIKLDSQCSCPFLNNESLCNIQLELGESFLSNTCQEYPRSYNLVDKVLEKSATLSCPEIARLALLNSQGIDFTKTVEEFEKNIPKVNKKITQTYSSNFELLREYIISVIQNREYNVEERLILVGIILNKIQKLYDSDKRDEISEVIEQYKTFYLNVSEVRQQLKSFNIENLDIHIKICEVLMKYRTKLGITNKRYIECLTGMTEGLCLGENLETEDVKSNYNLAKDKYFDDFNKNHHYLFENYLTHLMFQSAFPANHKNIFDDYVMLVINYTLIKLHLIGMSQVEKEITVEMFIKCVQSFTKTMDHNHFYLKNVYRFLKDNSLTNLAHMVVLIKS